LIDPSYVEHVNRISIAELREMLRIINEVKYPEHKKLIEARITELEKSAESDNIASSELGYNLKLNEEIKSDFVETDTSVREKMLTSKAPRTINFLKFWAILQIVLLPIITFAIYKDTFRYFDNYILIGKIYFSLDILIVVSYLYLIISILRILKVRTAETFFKLRSYLLIILVLNLANLLLENYILNDFNLKLLWDSLLEQRSILFTLSFYLSFVHNKAIEAYYSNPDIILFETGPIKW